MSLGHGYEITTGDVLDAYAAVMQAAPAAGVARARLQEQIREMLDVAPGNPFMQSVLARHLAG